MRWAPACLFSALFLTSLGLTGTAAPAAPSGARHSTPIPRAVHHGGHGFRHARFHHVTPPHHRHGFRPVHKHGHHGFHKHQHHKFRHHFATPFWPYVATVGDSAPIIVQQNAPAPALIPGIPSVADLPAATGIRSAPAGSPTLYVLDGRQSLRSGGAKIVTLDATGTKAAAGGEGQVEDTKDGPRIIHLSVPVGR
jgi:hypothetical protein